MKPTVRFLPAEVTITVPSGTTINDAARMAELTTLHLPCGGRGTCGKCLVEVTADNDAFRSVPACTTKINRDCIVKLPAVIPHAPTAITIDASVEHFDTTSEDFSPVCRIVTVTVSSPSAGLNYADLERLEQVIGGSAGDCHVHCSRSLLQQLAASLRQAEGTVIALIAETGSIAELLAITPGTTPPVFFGVACDIGTTTVAVHLIDLKSGAIVASAADYNAQISRGGDIISRINYARTAERLEEMRRLAIGTVNDLLSRVYALANADAGSVYAMVIAGNCTMTHLALGLPPQYIREAPYVPTVNHVPPLSGADCNLQINPDAKVFFSPGVGSYVGGDITAGLLCTDMIASANKISLFMDIGTNGEIVIGNSEFLLTCACSAGPAFEGSGIRCGMRADEGAIDSFTIDPAVHSIDYSVIGDKLPRGICGSGLISLLGELLAAGYIDRSGRLTDAIDPARKIVLDNAPGLLLVEASATAHRAPIVITENDIDNLIRTKGAIYAACDLLLRNAGLDFSAVDRVLIAGGFGKYIDVEAAIRIGLFPDIERSSFTYLGNTSLAGATRALLSKRYRQILDELPGKMTYVDLSSEPGYMDAYVAALFLPHTTWVAKS